MGITDSNIDISAQEDNIYSPEKALKLQYDFILIVSQYYEEIKEKEPGFMEESQWPIWDRRKENHIF